MSFETFADFLHMGGHALYVWLSFGVTAVAIAINLVHLSRLRSQTPAACSTPSSRSRC